MSPRPPGPAGSGRTAPGAVDNGRAAVLLLAGFLVSLLGPPRGLLALVALVPAGLYCLRALRDQLRARVPAAAALWTCLGLVLATATAVGTAAPLLLGGSSAHQECLAAAQTQTAAAVCDERARRSAEGWLDGLIDR